MDREVMGRAWQASKHSKAICISDYDVMNVYLRGAWVFAWRLGRIYSIESTRIGGMHLVLFIRTRINLEIDGPS